MQNISGEIELWDGQSAMLEVGHQELDNKLGYGFVENQPISSALACDGARPEDLLDELPQVARPLRILNCAVGVPIAGNKGELFGEA